MPEKKHVPDDVPRIHEPVDDSPEAVAAARMQDLARFEMDNDVVFDNSAQGMHHQADVGSPGPYGDTYAKTSGVTTSPAISRHQVPFERLKNKHPYLDASEIEALMSYTLGNKSVYEASVTNYEDFDPEKLEEVLAMDQVEVETFLGINPFADYSEEENEDAS
jgi:hypothetical protein